MEKELTEKQKRFCNEYLIDLNATQAAIRAGYSEKTAKDIGCENLAKPNIQDYIQSKQKKLAEKLEITQERVVAEYAKLAFSNMADFVNWNDGAIAIRPAQELTREQTACVSEITETTTQAGTNIKIKLHNKLGALDSIARHLSMFNDKLTVTGNIDVTKLSDDELRALAKGESAS